MVRYLIFFIDVDALFYLSNNFRLFEASLIKKAYFFVFLSINGNEIFQFFTDKWPYLQSCLGTGNWSGFR